MEGVIFGALFLIIAGGYSAYQSDKFIKDEKYLKNYVNSYQGIIARMIFGEETATQITKTIAYPMRIFGVIFVVLGIILIITAR